MSDFEVIVIGAGPGGYPAAIRAAQLGKKVAIVEKEALGGTCLNCGCIPTKALIAGAARYYDASHAEAFGVSVQKASFDYAQMIARKDGIVTKLNAGVKMLLQSNGVEIIPGLARFEGATRISVVQEDGVVKWISGDKIIIAAGSDSAMPGFIPQADNILESKAFLRLTKLPKRLLVLGGGVIGCEFACMAARLGTKVTIVEMLEDIIMPLDSDVRRVLKKSMETLGITILTGAPLTDIVSKNGVVTGRYKDQTVEGDVLLVAVGRRPCTRALCLERAGVKIDERGTIPVDHQGRTNIANIFAIGDLVTGAVQLAHAATQRGIVAAEAACGVRSSTEQLIPACIFTMPEIGMAGLTEAQAKRDGRSVKCVAFPFVALGKALAQGETEGFVKWIADAVTGQVLGAEAVGSHATELIAEATLAIRNELTLVEVAQTVHSHPTMSEAWMEAAHVFHDRCISLPKRPARKGL